MASTVTITNTNTNPKLLGKAVDTTVISPTGVTTPRTPYTEYTNDMITISNGSISVPVYNKVQYIIIPAGKVLTISVEDYKEIAYYEALNIFGATIVVNPKIITTPTPTAQG